MAKNTDFDFEQFAVSAISFIDSIRSFRRVGNAPVESRINAFYRAVGLPAVIKEDQKEEDEDSGQTKKPASDVPDRFNNGNIFSSEKLVYDDYKKQLLARQTNFSTVIDQEEINNFLDTNPGSLDASLNSIENNGRVRGSLLPVVVDGEIEVFPQGRRIAGAFMIDSERKHSKNIYIRPLIESIILIKLKGENVVNSTQQDKVASDFNSSETLSEISKNVEKTMSRTINNISGLLEESAKLSGSVRSKTGLLVVPEIAHIAQQNPILKLPEDQTKLSNLDRQKISITNRQNIRRAEAAILEFEDTINNRSRSTSDSALTSHILKILVPEESTSTLRGSSKSVDKKLDKAKGEAKELARILELIYGTFGGISGIDVLAVIIAMFRMSSEELVGLLNENSQERLARDKGSELPALKSALSVSKSLEVLENNVSQVFSEIISSIGTRKLREKKENQGE